MIVYERSKHFIDKTTTKNLHTHKIEQKWYVSITIVQKKLTFNAEADFSP